MSFFGIGQQGITLKELLENPELQIAPSLNDQGHKKEKGGNATFNATSAFLGPNLWNNPTLQDDNFQLEYMDLDEFLSENGIPVDLNETSVGAESDESQESPTALTISQPTSPVASSNLMIGGPQTPPDGTIEAIFNKEIESPKEVSSPAVRSLLTIDHMTPEDDVISAVGSPGSTSSVGSDSPSPIPVEFEVDDQDLALSSVPGHDFDPKRRRFTVEELKPQPVIKKSQKIFVPEDSKDDKYWNRRKKNNVAAKRSRDARRIKENQIAMRASFLEKENETLKKALEKMKKENVHLKTNLSKYESIELD